MNDTDTAGGPPRGNAYARDAFLLSIFSILPCFPIGIIAFVYGIRGLRERRKNPLIKGAVFAWIGIIVGGFFGLVHLAAPLIMIFGGDIRWLIP